jgi:glycosyltransferase involved in cell wall biosynthesis
MSRAAGTRPLAAAEPAAGPGLPTVSVVVPTRDRPELLARAVRSILGQRYAGPIECIVVFDRSEPALPEVDVAEGRSLRAVTNQRTPGLAGARNSGGMEATGDLLAFCDDDDEWLPDKLRLQVEVLERNPKASAAGTGIEVRYGKRRVLRPLPARPTTFRDLLRSRRTELHPSSFLVRREDFLGRIGMVDESIPGSYAEDYEWLLRAARVGPIVGPSRPLVRVYWHRSSYFAERWQTIVDALTYLLDRYPEFHGEPDGLARIYGQIAFANAAAGNGREARRWARRCLRIDLTERRAYLAFMVSVGVPASLMLRMAHLAGKGI